MLPDEDSALRAKLLMYREGWRGQESNHSITEAVAMARRVGDRPTLATVLWNWHYANPDDLGQRLEVADELVGLAAEIGDQEQYVLALQWRISDRFEASDLGGMHEDLRAAVKAAESLRLPFLSWGVTVARATVAHFYGRLDEAEALANEALGVGRQCGFPVADWMYTGQLLVLAWSRSQFTEMAELARQGADQFHANSHHFSILRAVALAELGRRSEANSLLDHVLAIGPWAETPQCRMPAVAAVLAQACWLLGRREPIPSLIEVMEPLAGSHVVAQIMVQSLGACDRYLGQLLTLEERFDEADASFQAAHELHERIGAQVWLPHGWMDHARMLLLRGGRGDKDRAVHLLEKAESCFLDLGATGYAERCRALRPQRDRNLFRLDGGEWKVRYGGTEIQLRDSKGLQYLAVLLSRPGQQVPALELTGERPPLADGRIESRLRDFQGEIDEARADNDLGRLERAEEEFDDLVARLQGSTETSGERARQSATRAVKGAIDRIATGHGSLGDHLRTTVRTGMYSSYTPDARSPIEWET